MTATTASFVPRSGHRRRSRSARRLGEFEHTAIIDRAWRGPRRDVPRRLVPWVAGARLEQLLGAAYRHVGRDGQLLEGRYQPGSGLQLRTVVAASPEADVTQAARARPSRVGPDGPGAPGRRSAITDEASAGNFWNCLVRHLGVWGALAVFSALGAALIILTGTGPIGLPLTIWLIGTFGGGTAVIILNCAINPFS